MTPHERAAIGPLPRGRGIAGPDHPQGPLVPDPEHRRPPRQLRVPREPPADDLIPRRARHLTGSIGRQLLPDGQAGAPEFTPADQRLVELFALHAGIAIDNARLHQQAADLAIVQERDRIGRDLHDGIIQSLYAVSLSLEDVPELMTSSQDEAEGRVDAAIDSLHVAIRELRNFIYGLRPETFDGGDVPAGLVALAEQFRYNTLIDIDVDVAAEAGRAISAEHGAELLHLARESPATRRATRAPGTSVVTFRREEPGTALVVADDGVGFDPSQPIAAGHRGLENMRTRAASIGATLRIESAVGQGTRIIVSLPDDPEA